MVVAPPYNLLLVPLQCRCCVGWGFTLLVVCSCVGPWIALRQSVDQKVWKSDHRTNWNQWFSQLCTAVSNWLLICKLKALSRNHSTLKSIFWFILWPKAMSRFEFDLSKSESKYQSSIAVTLFSAIVIQSLICIFDRNLKLGFILILIF